MFHGEWERRAFALDARDGHTRPLEHRHVALRAREPAGRRLSQQDLLRDLAGRPRAADDRARPCRTRRDRGRPPPACGKACRAHADGRARRDDARPRRPDRARRDHAGALQARRSCARKRYSPADAHAAAAVCARPSRHRRTCARLSRVPGHQSQGQGENPQWLYTVRFDGRDLWGEGSDPTISVSVDAFEPYLEVV